MGTSEETKMPKGNSIIPNAHFHKKNLGKYGPYPPKSRNNQAKRKEVRRMARDARAAKIAPRPLKSLRPSVRCATIKYNTRARLGRGFTFQELKEAKISAKYARTIGISVDHRRRNKSIESLQVNAARLKAYLAKVVVFPRKNAKPKTGDEKDKAKREGAQEGADMNAAFPLASPSTAVETKKVTAEMAKFNAYAKIRNERTMTRYAGIRAKRIADKEAEEALLKKK